MALTLAIQGQSGFDGLPARNTLVRWILATLERDGELTVRFVGAAEARRLNREFRGKDYATNVLTFDYAHEPLVLADLVLCAPVVAREARTARIPRLAHYAHLLVHGALHAQGYEHEHDDEAQAMEARESELMLALGFADPYRRRGGRLRD